MLSPNPRTVLLVDDDGDLAEAAAPVLVERGYAVRHCSDGGSALWLLHRIHVDLVVIDGSAPHCQDLLAAKAADPRLSEIRVLLVTVGAAELEPDDVDVEVAPVGPW
jgi:DNA-binding NtrC family response regulator